MKRQATLALVGGGFLGLAAGGILGAILGRALITIEPWQENELYGLLAIVERIRGTLIGAVVGGLVGMIGGIGCAAVPARRTGKLPPGAEAKSTGPGLD